ncbi:protein-glutamate O-methyltransferase CheR [Salipiger sp. IMCC34102]|uniref:CheR family methyltransferase n=1 Tax=Salipiger sp. IMCC34102 TaxID=2510647 RepID=UPI00101BFDC7|nr:protein-glutamate O-methyltransferase CheR [Salipiger sp. IMCC34102]RYH00956.1 protein-glutamate O-methyltransferase CheR [Salipiger sp. IMCC34102]
MLHRPINPSPLRPEEVRQLVAMARTVVGITIDTHKTDFLSGRLGRRLVATGAKDYAEYCRLLQSNAAERTAFGEALTTHTTSFFREKAQYDWLLEEGIPALVEDQPQREVVIWSAACSTGQEGYSALMVMQQARDRGHRGIAPRLIGTDISRPVVQRAKTAVYSKPEVEGISLELRRRFLLSSKSADDVYRIVPELREQTTWRPANLASGDGLDGISADIVFLRNILIYFDEEIRTRVIDNVFRRLKPGGILMTGHTEASHARRDGLDLVRPSIYRKVT